MLLIWTILTAATALVWATRHLTLSRAARRLPPLHAGMYPDAPGESPWPPLSVIIAAKDEEQNIEPAVQSWLAQDYPDFELIVVNDRSTDRTGEILERLAGQDPRLRVVHVRTLREGWFGKNNAMREGVAVVSRRDARAAEPPEPWLCFSDADCVMTSPRALRVAVRHALEQGCDFLSILPVLHLRGAWERIVQPACGGIMMIWFNPLKVNDPRSTAAYANGAFMLIRSDAYHALGGHVPFRTEVNEDMHMARAAKRAGMRLRVVLNHDLYRVRMYNSFAQAWRGWSRIFYGCFGTFRRLAASLLALLFFSVLPWLALAVAGATLTLASEAAPGWKPLLVASAAACAVQQSVMFRFYRISHLPPLLAPTYPLGAVIALGMLVSAMRRLGGRTPTTWRGTTYRADRVVATDGCPSPQRVARGDRPAQGIR